MKIKGILPQKVTMARIFIYLRNRKLNDLTGHIEIIRFSFIILFSYEKTDLQKAKKRLGDMIEDSYLYKTRDDNDVDRGINHEEKYEAESSGRRIGQKM